MALSERQLASRKIALERAESAGYLDYAVPAEPPEQDQRPPKDVPEMTEKMSDGILGMLDIPDGEIISDTYQLPNGIMRHTYVPSDDGNPHHYWRAIAGEPFSREVLEVRTGPFTLNGQTSKPLLRVTTPGNGNPVIGREAFEPGAVILSKVFSVKPTPAQV